MLIVFQCRLGSSRLPAKALLPIAGMPSIVLAVKRVSKSFPKTWVATSTLEEDSVLVECLERNDISYVRGDLNNVLARFCQACEGLADNDYVVRLTADNLFPDDVFVQHILDYTMKHQLLYCTTVGNHHLPYGLSCEVIQVGILRQANRFATRPEELEHVTPWIQDRHCHIIQDDFPSCAIASGLRCTLDTYSDYLQLQKIFGTVKDPIKITHQELCRKLREKSHYSVPQITKEKHSFSKLILGTAQFGAPYGVVGGEVTDCMADAIIDLALQRGVTTFDTARGYPGSEAVLGKKIHQYPTVVYSKLDPFYDDINSAHSTDIKNYILQSVFKSCYDLKRKKIDILLCHRVWQLQNHIIFETLQSLRQQNIIGGIGCSVNSFEEALLALQYDIDLIQLPINIMDWRWQSEAFKALIASKPGIIVVGRSIFLQGLLLSGIEDWPSELQSEGSILLPRLNKLASDLKRENITDLCLAYVLGLDWIDAITFGCKSTDQLLEILTLSDNQPLDIEERKVIEGGLQKATLRLLTPSLWT